ncbi:MAG TPA: hypothetical protein VLJ61_15820 [Pyrinomonadaceae bacterium]|nr:hypothetical protein [Pyrinomonadaceae bacterium]
MKTGFKLMLQAFVAAFVLSALAHATLAQSDRGREQAVGDHTDDGLFSLRTLNKRTDGSKRRDSSLKAGQLQEDFKRLQILNRDLSEAVSRGDTLDLKLIAKSAAEMKERAERLDDNLSIPQRGKVGKRPEPEAIGDQEQLKRALRSLNELVTGFAHNPALTEARPDDARLSAMARRDLADIVELSGHITVSSKRLDKAARNHP